MFSGFKFAGIVGLVGILSFAGMSLLYMNEKVGRATAEATVLDLQRVNAGLRSQTVSLRTALSDEKAQRLRDKERALRADAATAELMADLRDQNERLTREIEHAFEIDDGPAAPILQYAANSLRLKSETIAALRARHDRANGDRENHYPGADVDDLPAAAGSWPTTQREFAILAMKFGDWALEHAKKLAAVADRQAEENAMLPAPP